MGDAASYLTWLETNETKAEPAATKSGSGSNVPVAPLLKPKSSPAVPMAPALGVKEPAKPAPAKAERRPKKGTDPKAPVAPNATPAPVAAAPVAAPIVQAAPLVADPGVAEQYDVELIDLSVAPPPLKGWRPRKPARPSHGGDRRHRDDRVPDDVRSDRSLAINGWFSP